MKPLFFTLAIIASSLCSCQKDKASQEDKSSKKAAFSPFFSPKENEAWIYQTWNENMDGQRSTVSERITHCKGPRSHPSQLEGCFQFDNYEKEKPTGSHYWLVNKGGIYTAGYKASKEDSTIKWLTQPFPIYLNGSHGGDIWKGAPRSDQSVEFRHLGEENVQVPAGNFLAVHIQMNHQTGQSLQKYDFWFARDVGLIKERWWKSTKTEDPQIKIQVLSQHLSPEEATTPGGRTQ